MRQRVGAEPRGPRSRVGRHVGGVGVRRTGTLLMFDLGTLDFGYKAMMRVMPVVTWTEGGAERTVSPRAKSTWGTSSPPSVDGPGGGGRGAVRCLPVLAREGFPSSTV